MPTQEIVFSPQEIERFENVAEAMNLSRDDIMAQLMSKSLDHCDQREKPRTNVRGEIRFLKRVK